MADSDKANLTQGQLKTLMTRIKNAGGGGGATKVTVSYADLPTTTKYIGCSDAYVEAGAKWISLGELLSYDINATSNYEEYELTITNIPTTGYATNKSIAIALPSLALAESKGDAFACNGGAGISDIGSSFPQGILLSTSMSAFAGYRLNPSTYASSLTLNVIRLQGVASVTYIMRNPNVQNENFVGWINAYIFGMQARSATGLYDNKYNSDTRFYSLGYNIPASRLAHEINTQLMLLQNTVSEVESTANNALRRAVKSDWNNNNANSYAHILNRPFYDARVPDVSLDFSSIPTILSTPGVVNWWSPTSWEYNGDASSMATSDDGAGLAIFQKVWDELKGSNTTSYNVRSISVTFAQYDWNGDEVARETLTQTTNARVLIGQDEMEGMSLGFQAGGQAGQLTITFFWSGVWTRPTVADWVEGYLSFYVQGINWTTIDPNNIMVENTRPIEVTIEMLGGELVKLDSKFLKVDNDTITVNSNGEIEASGGGIPTDATFWGATYDATNNRVRGAIYANTIRPSGTFSNPSAMGFDASNGRVMITVGALSGGDAYGSITGQHVTSGGRVSGRLNIFGLNDPINAQDAATKNYVDTIYPVGAVFTSTSSTAPTIAGGTWTQIGTQTVGSSTVYYYERTA